MLTAVGASRAIFCRGSRASRSSAEPCDPGAGDLRLRLRLRLDLEPSDCGEAACDTLLGSSVASPASFDTRCCGDAGSCWTRSRGHILELGIPDIHGRRLWPSKRSSICFGSSSITSVDAMLKSSAYLAANSRSHACQPSIHRQLVRGGHTGPDFTGQQIRNRGQA